MRAPKASIDKRAPEDIFGFLNDYLVDLSACCTKGGNDVETMCKDTLREPYAVLYKILKETHKMLRARNKAASFPQMAFTR